jgi:hypothetical protein
MAGAVRGASALPLLQCPIFSASSSWCRRWQTLRFADREFKVTFAALPEYIALRRTRTPVYALSLAVVSVVLLSTLMAVTTLVVYNRVTSAVQQAVLEEHHKKSVLEATKAAHEKTIAYACHQLRYVARCSRLAPAAAVVGPTGCRGHAPQPDR